MKRKLIIGFAFALAALTLTAFRANSQITTNPPVITSPIIQFLETPGATNWRFAGYGIYDTASKKGGGGIGAGYEASPFTVAVMRFEYLNKNFVVPSGNIQLQVPVTLFGKVTVIPLTFAGVGTTLNNNPNQGSAIGIFGIGGALSIKSSQWYIPSDVLLDYERWTGGGFNDDQVRLGLSWNLF